MSKPKYNEQAGQQEAQHLQIHHEEEMQKFFRQSNVQNLVRIHRAGYERGWAECEAYMKELYGNKLS